MLCVAFSGEGCGLGEVPLGAPEGSRVARAPPCCVPLLLPQLFALPLPLLAPGGVTGSRNDTRGSFSRPAHWMMAEAFLAANSSLSSSRSTILWSPIAWAIKDLTYPKDNLHTKHINIGLIGTCE